LVAYLTAEDGEFSEANIRKYVLRRLPEYMAPVAYIRLRSLPLTINGKLDRNALPVPEWVRPEVTEEYVPPRSAVEKTLCEIWSRVLGMEPVGVEDDFFEFGGHSLLATQVISQVREVFGLEIELRRLFEASTVAAFAQVVENAYSQRTQSTDALLDRIDSLSPQEVDFLLSKEPKL
jgi:acyl carrier protein